MQRIRCGAALAIEFLRFAAHIKHCISVSGACFQKQQTPLALAAEAGNAAVVEILLQHGADVNVPSSVSKLVACAQSNTCGHRTFCFVS